MQPNASRFYVTLVDKSKLDSDLPKNISSLLLDHVLAFSFLVWLIPVFKSFHTLILKNHLSSWLPFLHPF